MTRTPRPSPRGLVSPRRAFARVVALAALLVAARPAAAYPTDETARTGIRRLAWQHAVDAGERSGRKDPPGATWPSARIELKMLGARDFRLNAATPKDPELQAGLEAILKREAWRHYTLAVLDISDPLRPRYAAVQEQEQQTPGSVAKVLVAAGLFQALKDRFGDDLAAREAFLRGVKVTADEWAMPNSHEVPVVNGEQVSVRPVRLGDVFSLWEWLDHALSPSSNAAGTMMWREATLMGLLGADYPPPAYDAALFAHWEKPAFTAAAFRTLDRPLADAGLDPETFKLRLFFTKGPSRFLANEESRVSPLALVQWMLAVEQGRMVDEFSSRELKRLLYLTRRRIRYAKAPELDDAAVFFKSGSLFQCKPEPGFTCAQYEGNEVNVLNALVEVEIAPPPSAAPATAGPPPVGAPLRPLVYIVAVMSNELKRNAADDHARLASLVHKLLLSK